mmetsp:Transcript_28982/g.84173  ORF Transcript_28982/g.84173 Transcript_28982/m.84173 type:complete len:209 (+) Transcript_28982:832-1458(+)
MIDQTFEDVSTAAKGPLGLQLLKKLLGNPTYFRASLEIVRGNKDARVHNQSNRTILTQPMLQGPSSFSEYDEWHDGHTGIVTRCHHYFNDFVCKDPSFVFQQGEVNNLITIFFHSVLCLDKRSNDLHLRDFFWERSVTYHILEASLAQIPAVSKLGTRDKGVNAREQKRLLFFSCQILRKNCIEALIHIIIIAVAIVRLGAHSIKVDL